LHWRYVGGQQWTSAAAICHLLFRLDFMNLAVGLSMNICIFIGHWFWADEFQNPPQRQCVSLAAISRQLLNQQMKKTFPIFLLIFSVINVFGQNNLQAIKATEKSFPTNLNQENFKTIKKLDGKVAAFDGTIEKVENSRNNTPFYKLRISADLYLWTVLMFKNEANKIGDTIRVVGYLGAIEEPDESEKKYLDGKYMVIAFVLVDFKNSNFLFLGSASRQKQEWIDGKIPSSK
jgi:hypothetical protein